MSNHTPIQLSRRGLLRTGAGIAGAALLGGAAACGGGSTKPTSSSALNYYYQPCLVGQNAYSMTQMEKTFGFKFANVYALSMSDYATKFQAFLAQGAGAIPDAMAINGPDMLQKFAAQGAFAEVSVDTIRQYAPKYTAGVDKHVPLAWTTTLYNGKNYGFPGIGGPGSAFSPFTEWRTDLLEKAGVSGIPDTLDECEQAFAALKKIGVYGMSTGGQSYAAAFMTIFGAHGVLPMQWQIFDGKVVNAAIRPETKEALALLASWYKNGYIDPECMGPNPAPKFIAGKVGMWDYGGPVDIDPDNQSGRLYAIHQTNPAGKLAFGLPPQGPGGRGAWTYGTAGWPQTFGPDAGKDKGKMKEVLQIWDEVWSNNALATKLSIGEEGTMYKLTDASKGIQGGWEWIGKWTDPVARQADGFNPYGSPFIGAPSWDISLALAQSDPANRDLLQTYGKYGHADLFQNGMTVPGAGQYMANLQSLKIKAFSQIITGAAPVSSFDSFVRQWNAQGGTELAKAASQLYQQHGAQNK